jgi:hypothetical protein
MRFWSRVTRGFGFAVDDGHEVTAVPKVLAFAFDELAGCFAGLFGEYGLLFAYPG